MSTTKHNLLFIGDSITKPVGWGNDYTDMFPHQVEEKLTLLGCSVRAFNFGNSGDVTVDALDRLNTTMKVPLGGTGSNPTYIAWSDVFIMLGANQTNSTGKLWDCAMSNEGNGAYTDASTIVFNGGSVAGYSAVPVVDGGYVKGIRFRARGTSTGTPYVTWTAPGGGADCTIQRGSIDTDNTTFHLRAIAKFYRNGCVDVLRTPNMLPENRPIGERWLILYDTSTTGGVTDAQAALAINVFGEPARLGGTISALTPTIWVSRNGKKGEAGWSRIADQKDSGVRVHMLGQHYRNYSGGDTTGTPLTPYASYRQCSVDAVTAEGDASVDYLDVYNYMRGLIVSGVESDGTGSYGAKSDNQHPGPYGCSVIADGIVSTANTANLITHWLT